MQILQIMLSSDHKALAECIIDQVNKLQQRQSCESLDGSPLPTNELCTAYLPNYMYYQSIAADPTTMILPTSLCSGTGITNDHQHMKPDMLNVLSDFESYIVGSGHLFREDAQER